MTFEIINPEALGAPRGWNNGMLSPSDGRVLFVAGQTADHAAGLGFVEQWTRAMERVLAVVRGAGGEPSSIGRLTIFVTDIEDYRASVKPLGQAYRRLMDRHYPAMTLVAVASLVDPNAVVEIEATAVI